MSTPALASSPVLTLLQDIPMPIGNKAMQGYRLPNSVAAGFPSPAEDLGGERINFEHLIPTRHPQATYFMQAKGNSMVEAGIFDKDVLVVDRALKPVHGHVVVAMLDGDFTVKHLYQRAGRTKLKAANPTYPDITLKDGQTLEIWGVVIAIVRQMVH